MKLHIRGKTHLSVALGVKALEAGHTVLFLTLESMITRLTRARMGNRVERQLIQFVSPKVLIIDEMGYLPMNREEGGTLRVGPPPKKTEGKNEDDETKDDVL